MAVGVLRRSSLVFAPDQVPCLALDLGEEPLTNSARGPTPRPHTRCHLFSVGRISFLSALAVPVKQFVQNTIHSWSNRERQFPTPRLSTLRHKSSCHASIVDTQDLISPSFQPEAEDNTSRMLAFRAFSDGEEPLRYLAQAPAGPSWQSHSGTVLPWCVLVCQSG
jgi:hypothetical protein